MLVRTVMLVSIVMPKKQVAKIKFFQLYIISSTLSRIVANTSI